MTNRPPSIFHETWWLDAVSDGRWEEVTFEAGGSTVGRLPFVRRRIGPLTALTAPPLTNRLGPTVTPTDGKRAKRLARYHDAVAALIEALPRHQLFVQNLRDDADSWWPFHAAGFGLAPRLTYLVRADSSDDAWSGIVDSTRSSIRKAERALTVAPGTAGELHELTRMTFGRQQRGEPYPAAVLARLVEAVSSRGLGEVLVARDADRRPHAGALFVFEADRVYYLVGGADPSLRASGAGSLLVWEGIKRASELGVAFDFEGSMLPSVERHFRSFGATPTTYLQAVGGPRPFVLGWHARQAVARR